MFVSGRSFFPILPILSFWNARFCAPFLKPLPKLLAVIGSVCNRFGQNFSGTPTTIGNRHPIQDSVRQFDLMVIGCLQQMRQRNSIFVDDYFPFGSLAALGFANTTAPFLAGAKLASRIPQESFNLPLLPNCPKSTRKMRGHTPLSCHFTKRSRQVEGGAYSGGMSFHRHPVFNTYKMPFMVLRSSVRGRPRPLWRGSNGRISAHSLFVSSVSRFNHPHSFTRQEWGYYTKNQ